MPTLADIYSAIGSAKRRVGDVLANPYTSIQQMVGNANDRARALNELTAAAAQEGMDYGPASQQLAQTIAGAYNPIGMTVYHGSPHLFERFDLGKIGTGEGAQAYGRGLYMAQNPEVAKGYQETLKHKNNASIIQNGRNDYSVVAPDGTLIAENVMLGKAHKAKETFDFSNQGAFYKVDLPDTHVRRMLDFDAPLKSQPKQVRDLAKTLGMDLNDLGGDLVARVGKGEEGKQILQKAGIRGIKYFDQMSRGEETGTRNFVVFDPSHLTILERNSQPIK